MELWTAFLLGFVGSAHCAGMCGPLVLALPAGGGTRPVFLTSRAVYNFGRLVTYSALGALFGLVGQSFAIAGLQRWVSLAAGAAILIGLLAAHRVTFGLPMTQAVGWVKGALGKLLQRRAFSSLFLIGMLNGLLPCGLVYAACAGATASGNVLTGVEYMCAFGIGTLPTMFALALAGHKLQLALRFKLQRLVPASLALVGALLLVRGLALGIPYLSLKLPAQAGAACCCH